MGAASRSNNPQSVDGAFLRSERIRLARRDERNGSSDFSAGNDALVSRRFPALGHALMLRSGMNELYHFGFALDETARLYVRQLRERARDLALDPMACKALLVLADNEGVTQQRLSELMVVGPMTIGRLLGRLEAKRLVDRRPHPENRRARAVSLTQDAKLMLPAVYQTIVESLREALSGTSVTDRQILMNGLRLVLSNLSAGSIDQGAPALVAVTARDGDSVATESLPPARRA